MPDNKKQGRSNKTMTFFVCFLAALAGLLFGLDIGVIAGALPFIANEFQISAHTQEWVVSSMMFGAAVGAVGSGWLSFKLGRKKSLMIGAILFVAGSLFSAAAPNVEILLVSRVLLGLAVGVASYTAPLYLSEIAPEKIRGSMISMYQLMITIGILGAYLSDTAFSYSGAWRWMLGVIIIPAVLLLIGVIFLPDSPRWFAAKRRFVDAERVLLRLRDTSAEAKRELDEIRESLKVKQSGWSLFKDNSNFRRAVFLGILLQVMQQFTRMNEIPPAERGVGMVFQSYALYPHLSVAENMSFGLKLAGAKKDLINQRVTQVAEVLQLAHLLERKPKALSGGQRQRVAIGRTLVAEPSVFLLDEPLSNLDAALRVQMRIEISRLHKRLGRTMIYVTHDQVEAMTLADKIVVLDAGRVAQVGKPLELYHYPADRFVAGFIGSPKMNFLPVKVTATAIDQVQVELPNRQQIWLPVDSANVQAGANMSLGIRPEHLLPSDIADVTLEGEVQVVEQLGHETQIHIQIPAIRQNLVYRQNDVVLVEEGATFAIGLPPERCHLFREDGTACRRLHKEPGV